MFDFRYHALSLIAVFVALTVGLLLGVAIGDEGLVSSAEQNLRGNLREDVRDAQAESRALREQLERKDRYAEITLPALVGDRLTARRVDLIFLDHRREAIFDSVREAVELAGGELALVGTLRRPLDLERIAGAAEGTQYEELADDPSLADDLGRRVGIQLVQGGRLLSQIRSALLSASSGAVEPSEAVVLVRTPSEPLEDEEQTVHDAFVEGMLDGLRAGGAPIVGVEEIATEPSAIPWYSDRSLPSVDNVDEVPGQASLAVLLAGQADGAYGVKDTRDAFVPDALVSGP